MNSVTHSMHKCLLWESNSSLGSHKIFLYFMGLECTLQLTFRNIPTNSLYYNIKFLQLNYWDSDMFSPFLMGYPQGACISIYIKKHTLLCSQELSTGPYAEPTESSSHPHNVFLWNMVWYYSVIYILFTVLLLLLRPVSVVEGIPKMKLCCTCGRILCDDDYSSLLGYGSVLWGHHFCIC